jgi:hypothetical protein
MLSRYREAADDHCARALGGRSFVVFPHAVGLARNATSAGTGAVALVSQLQPPHPQQHLGRLLCRARHGGIVAHEVARGRAVDQKLKLFRKPVRTGDAKFDQLLAKPEPSAFLEGSSSPDGLRQARRPR